MEKYEIFAKRDKVFQFDVLEYDFMPNKLRVQIRYIWEDALGLRDGGSVRDSNFNFIRNTICRELGLEDLFEDSSYNHNPTIECEMYLKHGQDMELLLSIIELSIIRINDYRRYLSSNQRSFKMNQRQAIDELNNRFKENGFGYEFTNERLIRKDSEILHEEVVKPALYLLQEQEFEGALDEFLKAHDHFRKGKNTDCIINAAKAFESTMKTIGLKEGWGLTGRENASDLISLLSKHQIIPSYLQTTLQGLATLRNKEAGHGQGQNAVAVPNHFVNYALHLCGTNIVMLIEAYKDFSK